MTNDSFRRILFRQPRTRRIPPASNNTPSLENNGGQEEVAEYRNNDTVNVPTSSSDYKHYTRINVPATDLPTTVHSEYTTVEFFPEEAATSRHINRSNIPPNTDWPGNNGFHITFQPQEKSTKSTAWTYSDVKEKLFVNMAVACPVNVHVKTPPPPGSVIRVMAIFSRPEHITDVVKRCLNHSNPSDPMNDGHPAPDHLVRCDNTSSKYIEDYSTGRQSVITEYEQPQVGMEYTTYLYRFMCLGSCVGGLNRRPLQLIFMLEKDGLCLGRKVIDLRICACPGRDRRTEEKHLEKPSLPKRNLSHPKTTLDVISGPPLKRQKSLSGDEESNYTITVHRRTHYEILKKMAEALELAELASLLTPEESSALHQRYIRYKKKKSQQSKDSQQSSEESSP